ncbi:MAG: Nif3-like dinuclear metal center hexameric protein [Clostridia bacterium]|nr:Nif3-like dinuclear metal center hexameric protein [Clostridia bacterium]
MIVYDIYDFLDEKYDFSSALPFDNVGLLVGDGRETVRGILVCLDLTDEAISEAVKIGANLIVTHHPVIFDPLKSVTEQTLVYRLIRNGISVISAHTNLDQADGGVNDALAEAISLSNIEKVTDSEGFSFRVGELLEPHTSEELAKMVGEKLSVPVKYVGASAFIKRVAVCGGSGGSMLSDVLSLGVDAFVTSDVKHNIFLEAYASGLTLIDAGHFNTEDVITSRLCEVLRENFSEITVSEYHFSPIKFI